MGIDELALEEWVKGQQKCVCERNVKNARLCMTEEERELEKEAEQR